ncbi:MAG: glycosyltransferase family 4 protein [Candidatus Vogelbacteria bacterium]|nr:glycosyltransferase family 4 protein [Candidatus Vogelbacteria bacterium]
MKILIVTQYFWPENFRINDVAVGLKEKGHDVTILTGIPNYPRGRFFARYGFFKKRTEDYHGIKIIRMPQIPRGSGSGIRLALNYLSFAFFSSILASFYLRSNKFDQILVYQLSPITVCLPALVLKKIFSIPIVLWVQDLWPESITAVGALCSNRIIKLLEALVRFIYHNSDKILVQSKTFPAAIEKYGIKNGKITYLPNSVEDFYKPISSGRELENKFGLAQGFRIMFAGNMGVAQDFETILAACEKLKIFKDIHWIILGDGRMRPWVEAQVEKRGLKNNVHLLGRFPPEEMPKFFAQANIMLVTLKNQPIFALTVPAKVQSYLACAKPIIAALNGEGARIITEAGAGLICPAENSTALADAVLKAYRMPKEEIDKMGLNGRKYFDENFSREMLLNRLDGLIKQVVEN